MTLLTKTTFQQLLQSFPRIHLRAFFVLSIMLLSPLSWATTVLEKDFPDLVHEAEVITVGTVTDIREQWDPVRKAPFTLVTFSNLDVLKGHAQESDLTLYFLGGHTPDGEILRVDGVPQFKPGERSVVFCTGNQRDFCPLVGIWQGVYRVTLDARQGVETVSDHAYVPITKVYKGKVHKSARHAAQQALPLSTLNNSYNRSYEARMANNTSLPTRWGMVLTRSLFPPLAVLTCLAFFLVEGQAYISGFTSSGCLFVL